MVPIIKDFISGPLNCLRMRRTTGTHYVAGEYILVVLLADILVRLPAGVPLDIPAYGPRLGVSARIVDCSLIVESVFVCTRVAFDDMQLFGVRMPCRVQPGMVVETRDVDDQRVAFPVPDTVAEIG